MNISLQKDDYAMCDPEKELRKLLAYMCSILTKGSMSQYSKAVKTGRKV